MARDISRQVTAWLRGNFLPYQLRWILDDSDFALCNKGRQEGLTDASAAKCVLGAFIRRRPQIVLSAAQDNANELLEAVRRHCAFLALIGVPEATAYTTNNTEEVAWHGAGRSIAALAANARTARSFHGDVYLDEYAFHADAAGIWTAAAPMATRGDLRLRVISTPNGATGKFYELCRDAEAKTLDGWSYHKIPLEAAIADGLAVDRKRLLTLVGGDTRAFAEAYECAFLDANLQYLPTQLVDAARTWPGEMPNLEGAEFFAGYDVGRWHDLAVLTVVALRNGVAWVVAIITAKRTAFRAQRKMLERAREAFGWSRIYIDKTGMGESLAEELVEDWGDDEAVPVTFGHASKSLMATTVFRWLRDGNVRLPKTADGSALRDEAIAVKRIVTPSANVVYESPRGPEGHGDRFWSFALALLAASGEPLPRGTGKEPLFAVA